MAPLRALAFRYLLILILSSTALSEIDISFSNGTYTVGWGSGLLIDDDRVDPFDPDHQQRKVMVSVFYPIKHDDCTLPCYVPYTPQTSAEILSPVAYQEFGIPNGTLQRIRLGSCCQVDPYSSMDLDQWPLLIFSPGLGSTRYIYNAIASALASEGYAVVTLDHTFESMIVEFPDHTYELGRNLSYWQDPDQPQRLLDLLNVRVADARFVLDQLGDDEIVRTLVSGAASGFNTSSAGFFGHSFGGATAVNTMMLDERILAAVDLDGTVYGNLLDTDHPALLFGRADPSPHNRTNDASWVTAWTKFTGWRRELGLQDSGHIAFTDIPLLFKLANLTITDKYTESIGTLDAQRSFTIITTYVQAFFDHTIQNLREAIFDGPSDEFPEVEIAGE